MAGEYNSVPLGQAGTGAAFILPNESLAANRLLETIDYNQQIAQRNALLKQQAAQQLAKSYQDNMFKAGYENSKILFNIRLDSKGGWYLPNIETEKNDKFPNGMKSRIKLQNMKLIDGKKWADFLRDINDPMFGNISDPVQRQLTSLFKGRVLQGCYAYLDLQCDDTTEAKLNSLEIWFSEDERSI